MGRHWNYRVLAHTFENEVTFQIHEVHYEDGVPDSYGEPPAPVLSDDFKDLKDILIRMEQGLSKPVLDADNWPNEYKL